MKKIDFEVGRARAARRVAQERLTWLGVQGLGLGDEEYDKCFSEVRHLAREAKNLAAYRDKCKKALRP
jgi:hypothetical protein